MSDGTYTQPQTVLNINTITIGGETPLMKAAQNGRGDICQLLLLNGADPLMVDSMNQRADQHAQCNGKIEVSNMLVQLI